MKICVIHPQVSYESARDLANQMGWDLVNPFKTNRRDFMEYAGVFNYGCNRQITARNVINKTKSVATCINKIATFEVFKKAGIPTVEYVTRKADVPYYWDSVAVRTKADGAKNEGLSFFDFVNGGIVPDGVLFSKYFEHEYECRIVVFLGKVVGAYIKRDEDGEWQFDECELSEGLTKHAIEAAKALDIDYVGFDVLCAEDGSYVFLEANSGPVLIEDVAAAIKEYIK